MKVAAEFISFFSGPYLCDFCRHVLLLLELAIVAGFVTGHIGRSYGIFRLFWHETPWKQAVAGLSVALLVTKICFIGFLLGSQRAVTSTWLSQCTRAEALSFPDQVITFICFCALSVSLTLVTLSLCARALRQRSTVAVVVQRKDRSRRMPFLVGLSAGFLGALLLVDPLLHVLAILTPDKLSQWLQDVAHVEADHVGAHVLATVFFLGLAGSALLSFAWEGTALSTPASMLCTFLGLLATTYGFVVYHAPHPGVAALFLFLLLIAGGSPRYKLRIKALAPLYAPSRLVRSYPAPTTTPAELIDVRALRNRWRDKPLVVVCASGGGIRSAVWSVAILKELERSIPDLPAHIRLITGASGGMIGAAAWTATLTPPGKAGDHHHDRPLAISKNQANLLKAASSDLLSPVMKRLVARDLPLMFLPIRSVYHHRGQVLADALQHNFDQILNIPFATLAEGERAGWRPSLIFAPTILESGRRLLISNLDLESIAVDATPDVNERSGVEQIQNASRNAYQFARLFPSRWNRISIATAAGLCAAFPFISPAVALPTVPRMRVVDAGYSDRYGIDLAIRFLQEHAAWLVRNVPGVILIQLRDEKHTLDGAGRYSLPTPLPANLTNWGDSALGRGLEELVGPLEGALVNNDASPYFRNLQACTALARRFPRGFFTMATFSFAGDAALSWSISSDEVAELQNAATCQSDTMTAVRQWWSDHTGVGTLVRSAQ